VTARAWTVVLGQELRDLWLGRGVPLCLAFSGLVGVIAYLTAASTDLTYIEQREAVNLVLQVTVAVGGLLTLLLASDAISGERERGTLEGLLLSPVSRRQLAVGKLLAALSMWPAAYLIAVPYAWYLGRGVGVLGDALLGALVVGSILALAMASFGILVSVFAESNRAGLSISLFVLLALYAPTQLPASAQDGWAGELLLRLDPVTAADHVIDALVIDSSPWCDQLAWLASPLVVAVGLGLVAVPVVAGRHLRLGRGATA
jgi:ABC-2 type transport system permease protein